MKIDKDFPNPLPPTDVKEMMDRMVAELDVKHKIRRLPGAAKPLPFFSDTIFASPGNASLRGTRL